MIRRGQAARFEHQAETRRMIEESIRKAESDNEQAILDFCADVERIASGYGWPRALARFEAALAVLEYEMQQAAQTGPGYESEVELTRHALPGYLGGGMTREVSQRGGALVGTVTVNDGEAARLSEAEIQPWDMKPGLLEGVNSKETPERRDKDGTVIKPLTRYNTIMFRHQMPGTAGMHGRPMEQAAYNKALPMEPWEYRLSGIAEGYAEGKGRLWKLEEGGTRSLIRRGDTLMPKGIRTAAGGWNPHGARIPELTRKLTHRFVTVDQAGNEHKHAYRHKANIYAGMRRMTQFYEKVPQQFYATWRRVSERWTDPDGKSHGSMPNSWWHNGLKRNPIPEAALKNASGYIMSEVYAGMEEDLAEIIEQAGAM